METLKLYLGLPKPLQEFKEAYNQNTKRTINNHIILAHDSFPLYIKPQQHKHIISNIKKT
jgi:hypothetical protein